LGDRIYVGEKHRAHAKAAKTQSYLSEFPRIQPNRIPLSREAGQVDTTLGADRIKHLPPDGLIVAVGSRSYGGAEGAAFGTIFAEKSSRKHLAAFAPLRETTLNRV
jgi:hypothetical protein